MFQMEVSKLIYTGCPKKIFQTYQSEVSFRHTLIANLNMDTSFVDIGALKSEDFNLQMINLP